jgi:hypothetical protein
MENLTYIKRDDYWEAWANWQRVTPGDITMGSLGFQAFVGILPPEVKGHDTRYYLMVTKDQKRRIDLLMGPHHRTIIKMFLAWALR